MAKNDNQVTVGNVTYIRSDEVTGKKVDQVAAMLDHLKENEGEPIPFEKLCSKAGAKYPQDVHAAMIALELISCVDRYTFAKRGSTRKQVAYAWRAGKDPQ